MNLKNIRIKSNISQIKLANLMNVDQSTISKWEQGITSPSISKTKKLAEIFNCKLEDLIKEQK